MAKDNTIRFRRKLGPTIDGSKPLLRLDEPSKREMFKKIRKEWQKHLKSHFDEQGGIAANGTRRWQPLADRYEDYKEAAGFSTNILEMTNYVGTLRERYQRNIKFNTKTNEIYIDYPKLFTGNQGASGEDVDAGLHQEGTNKMPARKMIRSGFTKRAKDILIDHLLGNK